MLVQHILYITEVIFSVSNPHHGDIGGIQYGADIPEEFAGLPEDWSGGDVNVDKKGVEPEHEHVEQAR